MGLIICPDCGGQVSDKAKVCIHCGAPLVEEKNIVRVKMPSGKGTIVRVTYTFTDDETGDILATAGNGEVISFELDKPTTIRCHLGRGFKDALIEYTPEGIKKYAIHTVNTFFGAHLEMQEIDVIDSDF